MQDMRQSGCTLAQILQAGQWRSVAVLKFIEEVGLEKDTAFEVAIESDEEEWID